MKEVIRALYLQPKVAIGPGEGQIATQASLNQARGRLVQYHLLYSWPAPIARNLRCWFCSQRLILRRRRSRSSSCLRSRIGKLARAPPPPAGPQGGQTWPPQDTREEGPGRSALDCSLQSRWRDGAPRAHWEPSETPRSDPPSILNVGCRGSSPRFYQPGGAASCP